MRLWHRWVAAIAIGAAGLAGWAGAGRAQAPKAQWVVAIGEEGESLDPPTSMLFTSEIYQQHLFDCLLGIEGEEFKPVPLLAEKWETINPTTWRFHLRKGVKFHNGKPLTAEDVKYSFEQYADTKNRRSVFARGISKIEIKNASTVDLITSEPVSALLFNLTRLQIVPKETREKEGVAAFAAAPVGTGPYKFVEWKRDQQLVLEANPTYWRGAPKIKRVIWKPIPDNFARVAALTRGEAQIITKVIPDHVSQIQQAGCCRVEHTLTNLVTVYLINAQKGPLASTKVRQALNYAVDKDKIIKELYKGYAIPIGSGIPNTDFGYNPRIKPYPYDPAKAKALLTEAGFGGGVDVDIQSGNGIHLNDRQLSEAVALMLQDVGVRAKIGVLEPSQRSQLLRANSFPGLLLADPASTTYDADGVIWRLRGPGGILHQAWPGNYEGTPFYKMMEEARVTLDSSKRLKIYHEAAQTWHDEAPELFLFQGEMIDGARNEIVYKARGDQRIILYDISYR